MFANLGSDHPAIMEAIVKGQRERKDRFPKIITCPHEVRLSSVLPPGFLLHKAVANWSDVKLTTDGSNVNG